MSESPQGDGIGDGRAPSPVFTDQQNNGKAHRFIDSAALESPAPTGPVALRIPADAGQLAMLRALAETIMLTADFTIDVVTDVRVALDEVATTLIAAAVPAASIECEFRFDEQRVRVRVGAVTGSDAGLIEHSFGWHFVETLTDSIAVSSAEFDVVQCGYPVVVELTRLRGDTLPG
ncbi:ATP-binding protein [Nocardia sp. NPDC059246]|uniref:ATP-binding protein n=1 Tax=unclassified Nocardia TaxID=2637762 RepID=UPI0036CA1F57